MAVAGGAGDRPLSAGELAEQLQISQQQLSPLLAEFEALDLVDRHRSGGRTYIRLGLTGRNLLDQPVSRFPWDSDFTKSARMTEPFDSHPVNSMIQ